MSTTQPIRQDYMPQGGIRVFIRDGYGSPRYEVGVIDDPSFELGGEVKDIDYHNWSTKKVVDGDKENFSFKLYEFRPEILEIINKGLAKTEKYDGATVVNVANEVYETGYWGLGPSKAIMLEYPGVDNTSVVITGSMDGALSEGTDYTLSINEYGYTVVTFQTGGAITTENQTITVSYNATPPKGFYVKPEQSGLPTGFVLEAVWTGKDKDGNDIRIVKIFEDCKPDRPVETFAGDKDDKGAYMEVKVTGVVKDIQYYGFE